ncbi:hypothetical protein B0H21DRAFT_775731 [Amylocystis lapponica]|nr:hypothetical protein B0H21DRAFT_775731 [Amylocystis lapponica]
MFSLIEDSTSGKTALHDTLILPAYAAGVSGVALVLQLVLRSETFQAFRTRKSGSNPTFIREDNNIDEFGTPRPVSFLHHVAQLGGPVILAYRTARLLACLTLFCLSTITVFSKRQGSTTVLAPCSLWLDVSVCGVYLYASILAVISVTAKACLGRLVTRHLAVLLLITWAVYVYRDLWPLATFTLTPVDTAEGPLFWTKFAILTFAAVVVPLLVPRQYIPVDPKEPLAVPAQEQTAPLLSMMLYTWMDETVYTASSVSHLPMERFPRMADYDYAKNLALRSYPHLDPFQVKKDRHIFWGLMRVFGVEYVVMGTVLVLRVFGNFVSPVVINRVSRDRWCNAFVRPWFWIGLLFLGPMLTSVVFQWYIFNSTRLTRHAEAIVTQLVFDHALRMRVKAETSEGPASGATTAVATPETASLCEPTAAEEHQDGLRDSDGVTLDPHAETGTAGGKQTPKSSDDDKGSNLIGRLNNLITSDMDNISGARDFLYLLVQVPLETSFCMYFLYEVLGWSAFVGLAVMVVLLPIPGLLARHIQEVQIETMKKTDARIQTVSEVMGVIRMVKLFGWEPRVTEQLLEKREDELAWNKKSKYLSTANDYITHIIPLIVLIVTFVSFVRWLSFSLSTGLILIKFLVMDMLRVDLDGTLTMIPRYIKGKVSLDRINDFLQKTELLDKFAVIEAGKDRSSPVESPAPVENDVIGFQNATFSWTDDHDGSSTPGLCRRNFRLRIYDALTFKRGQINLILGPTGSGKTSLLMALMGEMHHVDSGPTSHFNLPRSGGVAYAAQESWVLSETIRDNIIFGAPYDEERYNKVIDQCALGRDLSLFEAGDKTEVGEKGLTLRFARITLARAVYSSAEILLLDDVLAALDVHTAKWIVDRCFRGDLIRGRTVLLVTHNVVLASPIADFVVSLGKDGRIHSQGSLSKAIAEDKELSAELAQESKELDQDQINVEGNTADGKLVVAEEIPKVVLGGQLYTPGKLFFTSVGGTRPVFFWSFYFATMMVCELSWTFQTWFLSVWAKQYETIGRKSYISVYALLTLSAVLFYGISYVTFVFGYLRTLMEDTFSMALKLGAVFITAPIFTLPGIIVAIVGAWIAGLYVKAQLSAKREASIADAPRVQHFTAMIAGLTSIRAYGAEDALRKELRNRIDRYTRSERTLDNLYRWVFIRVEALGAAFVTSLAAYLVYGQEPNASKAGFSLIMAATFSAMTLWWVLIYNEVQVTGILERIQQYLTIEQEPKPTERGLPPAYWPASGDLKVENLSARYSIDGPRVLHDISFEVKSGERIGIVGRTGSGKSSLTLALLRCILTEGKVYYDGLPTDSINLDALRSNITIIPQLPELLSGTLRQNLDPFQQYDDAVLNDALRAAGLFSVQSQTDDARITLDSQIASGGNNLSVGQRQILALARAIVRQSKLLILDEDYDTDAVIQTSLRKELAKDVTLLTVAHRLQTIMDADKIMVLDGGRIAEFGPPSELLKNEKGGLRALVDQSGDRDVLYAMATSAGASAA